MVPTPSSDIERLREESLTEMADASRLEDDVPLDDLVTADEPPDLALVDLALASAEARAALLRPAPGVHLVVHDPVLKSWRPTKLDLRRRPPAIELALEVEAVRYLVGADGRPRAGNWRAARRMALTWMLETTGSQRAPWRLAVSNVPAKEIPGWP